MRSEHKGVGKQYMGCYIADGIMSCVIFDCLYYVRKDQSMTVGL